MRSSSSRFTMLLIVIAVLGWSAGQTSAQQPIGRTSADQVRVSGAVEVDHGQMLLGNGSTVTAGTQPVKIALSRGGEVRLCSSTSVHLAKDRSVDDPAGSALMMALDRGALEASYTVGTYSDVLLTPDLRILISGPGEANLAIRVSAAGDTCVDNRGVNAPYVTVSSQLEGGAYRVQPGQRVMFEHGSLREVVDREPEPCGCPPAPVILAAGPAPEKGTAVSKPVGGPSSTPADTGFPIAESEGLAAPPPLPSKPVVPAGEAHAEVTVPLRYNGENPAAAAPSGPSAAGAPGVAQSEPEAAPQASSAPSAAGSPAVPVDAVPAAPASVQSKPAKTHGGLFHRIGHFFSKLFG